MRQKILFVICYLLFVICAVKADWVQVNTGLNNLAVNALCSYSSGGVNYLFAGTQGFSGQDAEIYISTNNGSSWSSIYTPVNGGSIFSLATTIDGGVNYVYAGTLGYIFRSSNNGVNWLQLPFPNGTHWYLTTAASGNNVFAGLKWWSYDSGGVYKSTNYGLNWTRTLYGPEIHALAINNNYLYAGAGGGANLVVGVFKSTDSGSTWIQTPFANTTVNSLAINGNYIFAGTSSMGIYSSTNNGFNWTQTALNYGTIGSLLINSNNIFAGGTISGGGFYVSTDNGLSWVNKSAGINIVTSLSISNNYFFVGTDGGGVLRRPINELLGIEKISGTIPENYILNQNFPNPFNPTTKIRFQISKSVDVSLEVYDVLGRKISTLLSENLKPGEYETEWNGNEFPNGVYFYRLTADEKIIETKKMVLNK